MYELLETIITLKINKENPSPDLRMCSQFELQLISSNPRVLETAPVHLSMHLLGALAQKCREKMFQT